MPEVGPLDLSHARSTSGIASLSALLFTGTLATHKIEGGPLFIPNPDVSGYPQTSQKLVAQAKASVLTMSVLGL